ncbi:NAD(P)/FAD-dependent oxidoreductase [Metamycoplasma buccale]|uniref:NAD(P)/FAD-dependent oxidoreductase n=1 Tax=Metamycoplasma buccale TaxID=55602 RepID=UPI00398F1EAB
MKQYHTLIIGAGPAGLTAALYLSRNNLSVAFIEANVPGGKMTEQSKIENYPGFEFISGPNLSIQMLNQATKNGAEFIYGKVTKIESKTENLKQVTLENGDIYLSNSIIIATGMKNIVPLDIENIEKFNHKGVSYCVLCDGALYKNKSCAIVGGGNSAFEESIYLAKIASEVHIFIRDGIIAEKKLIQDVKNTKNIFIHENSKILKLNGQNDIEDIEANIDGKIVKMPIKAVFPYVGFKPATGFITNSKMLDSRGFIVVDNNMETCEKNIFAIGDVIKKDVRQITTATSDGTIAAKVINSRV